MKRRFLREVVRLELVGTVAEPKELLSRKASHESIPVSVPVLAP